MENLYFTQVVDGKTLLHEVNFKTEIDQDVLIGTKRLQAGRPFVYDNRGFEHSVFTSGKYLTHVIWCELLKWAIPLKYKHDVDKFVISGDGENTNVYLQDVKLIIHCGDNAACGYDAHIVNKNGDVPMLTNIYDDGRICIPESFEIATPPQNIIAVFETVPGNSDLTPSALCDDITLKLDEKNRIIASPHVSKHTNHELRKYITQD